jgi:hypothetical protein
MQSSVPMQFPYKKYESPINKKAPPPLKFQTSRLFGVGHGSNQGCLLFLFLFPQFYDNKHMIILKIKKKLKISNNK